MDKVSIGDNVLDTLVAVTEEEHNKGLMRTPWPPPVMSFPYETAEVRKFWMKKLFPNKVCIFNHLGF